MAFPTQFPEEILVLILQHLGGEDINNLCSFPSIRKLLRGLYCHISDSHTVTSLQNLEGENYVLEELDHDQISDNDKHQLKNFHIAIIEIHDLRRPDHEIPEGVWTDVKIVLSGSLLFPQGKLCITERAPLHWMGYWSNEMDEVHQITVLDVEEIEVIRQRIFSNKAYFPSLRSLKLRKCSRFINEPLETFRAPLLQEISVNGPFLNLHKALDYGNTQLESVKLTGVYDVRTLGGISCSTLKSLTIDDVENLACLSNLNLQSLTTFTIDVKCLSWRTGEFQMSSIKLESLRVMDIRMKGNELIRLLMKDIVAPSLKCLKVNGSLTLECLEFTNGCIPPELERVELPEEISPDFDARVFKDVVHLVMRGGLQQSVLQYTEKLETLKINAYGGLLSTVQDVPLDLPNLLCIEVMGNYGTFDSLYFSCFPDYILQNGRKLILHDWPKNILKCLQEALEDRTLVVDELEFRTYDSIEWSAKLGFQLPSVRSLKMNIGERDGEECIDKEDLIFKGLCLPDLEELHLTSTNEGYYCYRSIDEPFDEVQFTAPRLKELFIEGLELQSLDLSLFTKLEKVSLINTKIKQLICFDSENIGKIVGRGSEIEEILGLPVS